MGLVWPECCGGSQVVSVQPRPIFVTCNSCPRDLGSLQLCAERWGHSRILKNPLLKWNVLWTPVQKAQKGGAGPVEVLLVALQDGQWWPRVPPTLCDASALLTSVAPDVSDVSGQSFCLCMWFDSTASIPEICPAHFSRQTGPCLDSVVSFFLGKGTIPVTSACHLCADSSNKHCFRCCYLWFGQCVGDLNKGAADCAAFLIMENVAWWDHILLHSHMVWFEPLL